MGLCSPHEKLQEKALLSSPSSRLIEQVKSSGDRSEIPTQPLDQSDGDMKFLCILHLKLTKRRPILLNRPGTDPIGQIQPIDPIDPIGKCNVSNWLNTLLHWSARLTITSPRAGGAPAPGPPLASHPKLGLPRGIRRANLWSLDRRGHCNGKSLYFSQLEYITRYIF